MTRPHLPRNTVGTASPKPMPWWITCSVSPFSTVYGMSMT